MTPMDLVNKNLYVYCDGNPVIREDSKGTFWLPLLPMLIGAGIGAAIGAVSKIYTNACEGVDLIDGVPGAATGGAVYAGIVTSPLIETPVAPYLNQIASYSSAITESTANEVIDYVTHKKELTLSNIQKTVSTIFEDTVVNGTITMLTGEIAGKIVPVKGKYPVKGGVTRVVLSRWMRTFTNQTFFQAIEIGALFVSKINDLRRRYEH